MARAAAKAPPRVPCRCGGEARRVTSTLISRYDSRGNLRPEPKVTVVEHPCVCRASQESDRDACYNCLTGAHRRIRL